MKKTRSIFATFILSFVFLTILAAFAPTLLAENKTENKADAQKEAKATNSTSSGLIAIGIGIGMGIAVAGGAVGQGRLAGSALEGMARNPGAYNKIFTPMILGLAFVESLVIYIWVIAFLLLGKV